MPFSLAEMPTGSLLALAQLGEIPTAFHVACPATTRQRDPSRQSGGYVGSKVSHAVE